METYFAKNADILLKERHLTQQDFCKKLGKSKSNWENIVKTKNLEMLSQIATILDMKVEDVIGLNRQKFIINGFVKVADTTYEVQNREAVENLLKRIIEMEVGYASISQ
jgi:transcriptional regulator with XRE-family HTH domain